MDKHGEAVKFCPHFVLKSVLTSQQNRAPEHLKSFPVFRYTSVCQCVTHLKSSPFFETAVVEICPHLHGKHTGRAFKMFPRFLYHICISVIYILKSFPVFGGQARRRP